MACSNLKNSFCNLLTKLEQTTRKVFGFGSSQRTKPVLTSFSGKLRRGEHRPGTYSSLFGFALERKYQLLRREIQVGTKWEQEPQSGQEWEQSGNKNPKVGQEWEQSGNKVGTRTPKWDKNGNKVGTMWEQEPHSRTRMGTKR